MIFIGPSLSDPSAHFVTNIVSCIGTGDDLLIDLRKTGAQEEIYELVECYLSSHDERFIIYNAYEDEDFFIGLKGRFPELQLFTIFSDDAWRHSNYDRYLALYSDISAVTDIDNYDRYEGYKIEAYYMPWACNPSEFYPLPDEEKLYDVSFIGAAYGARVEYVRFLHASGINVRVFGNGWNNYSGMQKIWGGYLTHRQMLEVVSQSKINLNFLWTSANPEASVIKGRVMELAACKGFQLSSTAVDLKKNGFYEGDNFAVFHNKQDLLEKIEYYLRHDGQREAIALRSYEHVLRNHTWEKRFKIIFERFEKSVTTHSKLHSTYRVLVLAQQGVKHQISLDDERLCIRIVEPETNWRDMAASMDGVIFLNQDSTLNNESLYMMVFGLLADKSDMMASNFYVSSTGGRYWIRFRDRLMDRKRELLKLLPVSCMMFSGAYAEKQGFKLPVVPNHLKVSYIEYPSFGIKISYYQSRKLRLYFGFYRNPRLQFEEFVQCMKIGKALSLGVDKLWQRLLNNMRGKSSVPFNKS